MAEAKHVLVKGRAGLGNRILAALTGVLYARVTGRVPVIDWRDHTYSNDGSNAFPHFFDCPTCGRLDDISPSASVAPEIWRGRLDESVLDLRTDSPGDDREAFQRRSSVDLTRPDYAEEVAVMWSYQEKIRSLRPHFRGQFEPLAGQRPSEILRHALRTEMSLHPAVMERVDDYRTRWFTDRTVGVHIRYSDRRVRMDAIRARLDRLLRTEPELLIFLATDNIEVKKSFEVYPNVIGTRHWYPSPGAHLHQNPDCPDRLENGIEALVDLYLLAECDHLICDTTSSFARVAGLLRPAGDSGVVDVRPPRWSRLLRRTSVAARRGVRDLRDRVATFVPDAAVLRTDPAEVTWPGRDGLHLDGYRVANRDAGLFDVAERMAVLRTTTDPVLLEAIEAAPAVPGNVVCRLPTIAYVGYIPPFHGDHAGWQRAIRELVAIEDAVSGLAATFVASGDRTHADGLIHLLTRWAAGGAFTGFHFTRTDWQAWFALEATLFALALSYAVVRPFVGDRASERAEIEAWLARAARHHLAVDSEGRNYGWNNHYYRRALHAAAIGVVAGDHDLFRYGVSALYQALTELDSNGALPREMGRGARAAHYQNYALLYLVPIMEIVARQGYRVWELAPAGRTIHEAVNFTLRLLADPGLARRYTGEEQDVSFTQSSEYFAWMEVYGARFGDSRVQTFLQGRRPVWNRSSVGAATLYFFEPSSRSPNSAR